MPWAPGDATKHTAKADTAEKQRRWAEIANRTLEEHGDEGRAVRVANAAIAKKVSWT